MRTKRERKIYAREVFSAGLGVASSRGKKAAPLAAGV
jgi:hypothetical protein